MLIVIPVLLLASSALAQYPGAVQVPEVYKNGFNDITPVECKPWLNYLAGPECEGRGSGQPGYQKAANFMAAQFKKWGLKPMGENGTYFQEVPFTRSKVYGDSSISVGNLKLTQDRDLSLRIAQNLAVTALVVFLKVRGDKAELPESLDLANKVVVMVSDSTAPRRVRFEVLQRKPALALFVSQSISPTDWLAIPASGNARRGAATPNGQIAIFGAEKLATAEGIAKSFLDTGMGNDGVQAVYGKVPAVVSARVEAVQIGVPNVVGLLEGSDPNLKQECVGIGAHLDHLGKANGKVYPGADDDGSGTTALIAIMKAYHDTGVRPKRSILFMNFCGEELGLVGSAYLANHPPVPLDKMVCELQMDMVGRNSETKTDKPEENVDTIRLVGSKRISLELHQLILDLNQYVGFKFKYDEESVYTRSDHYNFASKGVPIAFLFDGFHPDYHQPTDTVDKINFEKIANSAKLYYMVSMAAANAPAPLKHDAVQSAGGS